MSARSASSIAGLTVLRGSPIVRVCTTIDHSVSKAPRQSVDGIGYPRPRSIERASSVQISRFRAKEFETALTITVPGSPSASHVHRLERDLPRRRTGCSDQLHTPQICDCTSDHSSSISPEGIRQLLRLASLLCGELAINRLHTCNPGSRCLFWIGSEMGCSRQPPSSHIISLPTHRGRWQMSIRVRMTILFFIVLALVPLTSAKDKKKQVLPNYVLRAQTVAVVIRPEAGEPLTSPAANRTAQTNVMNAMAKWGRFRLVSDAQAADLIVAVQKGHANGPTICNSPVDSQHITLDGGVQPADGGIPPAGVHGRSPDLTIPAWADRQVERRISATRPVCQK